MSHASETDPEDYAKLAREAQARLDEATARNRRARREAELALKRRADLIEAETPGWEILHNDGYSSTEILVTHDGFFVRSVFQRSIRMGETPISSATMLFVPGPPPRMVPDHGAIVVTQRDVKQGVNMAGLRLADLTPSLRIRTATEVLMRMPDGSVKVLKAPDMVQEPDPVEEPEE